VLEAAGFEAGDAALKHAKPVFLEKCARCLRCIYSCPQQALSPGREKFAVLKGGYDLDEIASRRATPEDWQRLEQLAPGPLYAGVRRYLQEAEQLIGH